MERLYLAMNSTRPGEAGKYVLNSINYMKDKQFSSFQSTRFIELFYIAKIRPDAFDLPEIHARILENSNFPEGLATTLFAAMGYAYQIRSIRFPACMLHLLYRDITGPKEFCNFEPCKPYIDILIIFFLFPQDRLKLEIKNEIQRINSPQIPSEQGVVHKITSEIITRINLLQDKPSDKDSTNLDILLTFLPLPNCTEAILNFFPNLLKFHPMRVPVFIKALVDYFSKCSENNQEVNKLLLKFSNLKVDGFEAEHQRALADIERNNPSLGIYTVNIDGITGSDIVRITLTNDPAFDDMCKRIARSMENKKIRFSRLRIVLEAIYQKVEPLLSNSNNESIFSRVIFIFLLFFKKLIIEITDGPDYAKYLCLITKIFTKIDNEAKKDILPNLEPWYVPTVFENSGLPVYDETVLTLLQIGADGSIELFAILYKVLYYASLFQKVKSVQFNEMVEGVLSIGRSDIAKDIKGMIDDFLNTNYKQLEGYARLISLELVICSPKYIGPIVWDKELLPYLMEALDQKKNVKFIPINIISWKESGKMEQAFDNFVHSEAVSALSLIHI